MVRTVASIIALLTAASALAQETNLPVSSTSLQLQRVVVEAPAADVLRLVLHVPPSPVSVEGRYRRQSLQLGTVTIPLLAPADVTQPTEGTRVTLEVPLKTVPESVLSLPLEGLPLAWEGTSSGGGVRLAVEGTINPLDRGQVELPIRVLQDTYTRIVDVAAHPSDNGVTIRILASLYNPMAWEVVASSLDYTVSAGEREIFRGSQRGLRLRPGQWNDLVLEQEASLGDLAIGGIRALVNRSSVRIDGVLVLRTPTGDRAISIQLGGL